MPVQKETVTINFSQGLDTLDDPNQLAIGKFTSLVNSVFVKSNTGEVGALKKRNGFQALSATVSTISYLTNYNGGLIGLGQNTIQTYSANANGWVNQGYYQPIGLNVTSLIKNAFNQTAPDSSIAPNGIGLLAFVTSDSSNPYQYAVFDSNSGQVLSGPFSLNSNSFTLQGNPKVGTIGSSFFVLYGTTANALNCVQINTYYPFSFISSQTIDSNIGLTQLSYTVSSTTTTLPSPVFDLAIASNSVFVSYLSGLYGGGSSGCNVVGAKISPNFTVSTANLSLGSYSAICLSNSFDPSTNTIYTCLGSSMQVTYLGNNFNFAQTFAPTIKTIDSSSANYIGDGGSGFSGNLLGISNISCLANNGICQSFYEISTYYNQFGRILPASSDIRADNIIKRPVTSAGVVGSETIIGPELGLGSKPFLMNGGVYLFGAYQSTLQSTYFLINSSGLVQSKFAYGNGGGYYYFGVPQVTTFGNKAFLSYLQKDLITPVNTSIGSNSFFNFLNPIYTQTGINLGTFTFTSASISARQTGNTLSFNGGFLWNYDGIQSFENNFLVYPEVVTLLQSNSDNGLTPQRYQYQIVFEATDNQGNIYQSSPGIGTQANTIQTGSIAGIIAVSTPRLSYRSSSKITIYRWSPTQPIFYKVGSFVYTGQVGSSAISPTLTAVMRSHGSTGNFTPDSIVFTDVTPDAFITGNEILYTSGNVLEDTSGPSFIATDVFDQRLWGISAEDNTLWYSKQLVSATPVEMVQDFALYVPPVQTALGTSQIPLCLAPMDDKQIIFCKNSILFINGTGPDNTGANSQYSEPTQIPSQVGCANAQSIVQVPYGLMFQSDNGIWLLGRDLQVKYIGKEVEGFNASVVTSATSVPGTNEIRFSLNTGQRLIYDLLADQWTTFVLPQTIQSSAIYNGLDTVLSQSGQTFQETPGVYLDGTTPVTMSFQTGWINLSGLQGYARAYWMDILGTFQSPHTYTVGIAYDYNPAIVQTSTINPSNVVGSGSFVEQWEISFQRPQCQSFQLTFQEISSGTAGAGVMISGISLTYGKKKTFARNIAPKNKV